MRSIRKWAIRIFLALVLAAIVIILWKRDEITRLMAVNSLFAEEKIVDNFSHMDTAFLNVAVPRGDGPTSELAYGADYTLPAEVQSWITDRQVTGLVVLKDGDIVHEDYFLGTQPEDRRISWSMAKSYLSALVGILLEDGTIASLDDPVTKYAPRLAGGAYDGASIRNVLNMASGVTFDEDYLEYDSDINRMGRVLALGGEMDVFATDLKDRFADPGTTWKYVSIDTHVISMVVRGATGRPIAELLSEKIVIPMGLEYAPYYLTDGIGTAFVLGGLNLTTRDYARFGQMFAQLGHWNGTQIVPADWVAASTIPSAPGGAGYGLHWWIPDDASAGEYIARGIYGQYIYINTASGVVIAVNAADRKFREADVPAQNIAVFRQIVADLEET